MWMDPPDRSLQNGLCSSYMNFKLQWLHLSCCCFVCRQNICIVIVKFPSSKFVLCVFLPLPIKNQDQVWPRFPRFFCRQNVCVVIVGSTSATLAIRCCFLCFFVCLSPKCLCCHCQLPISQICQSCFMYFSPFANKNQGQVWPRFQSLFASKIFVLSLSIPRPPT